MSDTDLLNGKKVLAVDDEPDILEILEELLSMCDLQTATSFEQAKALLESQPFDIAILDIMGVDGYGLLDIANQKKIPAVMLTAHAFSADHLKKTVQGGASSYVPKEKLSDIADYLVDVLRARQKGNNPWNSWQERLPSSYFQKRWGAAWKTMDKGFLDNFRDTIKARKTEED